MPGWSETLAEIGAAVQTSPGHGLDLVRRKYLIKAHQLTGRATILYGTKWTIPDPNVPAEMLSINDGDLQGLMEVMHGVQEKNLDLIIHSPGGGIDAAAALVHYLRSKFDHIRVIVPSLAMSAAAMVACSADRILMGKHSFLGPADPQFILPTPLGTRQVAAQSVVAQFNKAKKECLEDPRNLAVWAPILNQYGPDLIVQAEHATKLSKSHVKNWLEIYMLKGQTDCAQKAEEIAEWLSSHQNFNSHGTHISRDELKSKGLTIDFLENNAEEQDVFLSIFHAMTHTMSMSGVVKIIENHMGHAFLNQIQTMIMGAPTQANGNQPAAFTPSRLFFNIDPPTGAPNIISN
jgi:hypothetical protein